MRRNSSQAIYWGFQELECNEAQNESQQFSIWQFLAKNVGRVCAQTRICLWVLQTIHFVQRQIKHIFRWFGCFSSITDSRIVSIFSCRWSRFSSFFCLILEKKTAKKIQCSASKQSRVIGVMIKNTTTIIRGRCYKIEYWVFQTCSPGIDTLKCNWISPDSASWSLYHWGPPFYGGNNEKRTNYRTVIHVNLMLWTSLVICGSNLRALRLPSEVDKMRTSMLGQGFRK